MTVVALKPHARLAVLALGLLLAPLDRAEAAGFEIYNQGARAMGFAGAYVAQAYDPSAIYFNAAGVGFLRGKNLYLSAGLGNFKTDFTGEGPFPPREPWRRPTTGSESCRASTTHSKSLRVGSWVSVSTPSSARARCGRTPTSTPAATSAPTAGSGPGTSTPPWPGGSQIGSLWEGG